ncbi:ABC transporter ATP-binding protein [Chelatococcus sp. GCM10030263]|uniref:ABC transporter ATP-binding protein n=1 Tax=Chelatococcus sp. GCM10030263 TaxID=3273387 RepID=UPI0036105856
MDGQHPGRQPALVEMGAGIVSGGTIELVNVDKHYGDLKVVDGISASIGAGQFVSLLGPSGSGKTTTLMMVAGFVLPSAGRIVVDGSDVSRVPPRKRGFGMVFQNYSLFPHLNVFDNIAFPLRLRNVPNAEMGERVQQALDLVQLGSFGGRQISQLSGGQQQRIALARAVVFQPRVVLMDEPMGALDKNLRFAMQTEIKEIQRRLGMTVLYVTHDQEEAMNLSDRIVIMNHGRIEQIGAPQSVYDLPESPFVANFLGEANLFPGVVTELAGAQGVLTLDDGTSVRGPVATGVGKGSRAALFIRPERLQFAAAGSAGAPDRNAITGTVNRCSFLGSYRRYGVEIAPGLQASVDQPNTEAMALFAPGSRVELRWPAGSGRIIGTAP